MDMLYPFTSRINLFTAIMAYHPGLAPLCVIVLRAAVADSALSHTLALPPSPS